MQKKVKKKFNAQINGAVANLQSSPYILKGWGFRIIVFHLMLTI